MVESSLRDMIIKTFDPKKADTIFSEEGEVILVIQEDGYYVVPPRNTEIITLVIHRPQAG